MVASQLLVFLLVFLIITASITATSTTPATGHNTTYPNFQHLNVKHTIEETETKPTKPSEDLQLQENYPLDNSSSSSNKSRWKLKLFHIDSLSLNEVSDRRLRFHDRMKREVKRASYIVHHLSNGSSSTEKTSEVSYEETDFGSDVVSGTDQGSGEYFVRIGVGSPPRSQYVVIDSGSDIVWVQCQPCNECYQQSDPVFDPANSASYTGISCESSVCDRLENAGCNEGRCRYEVSYGDGSYTRGTLALETLTFGRVMIRNMAIGCGHMNRGMFIGAAGLLGLGGAFSYCLVSRGGESTGYLDFGRGAMPVGAAWVPLIRNQRAPSFYYIGLSGLGVGGIRVPIPEQIFELTDLGYGGVVMDTGTAVTRFPTSAYNAFRDTFIEQTANLPRAPGISIFDTCFDLNGFVSVRVPTVSFYFSGGPILTLPARNFLIPVDGKGTFCFAFAASPSGLSIIGNIQQEGIQVSFDGANGFVGFGPNIC